MSDWDTRIETALIAGRECGSCNACCIALTIDEPELRKPQGYRCRNARPDNSCAIYDTRPRTCRTFHCGWRVLKWIREPLRPDTSGVLVRLVNESGSTTGMTTMGVVFTLLGGAALKAEGLAESVAAAVAADIPVYLEIPGPPGHTYGRARMNDALIDAVMAKDKAAVLDILRIARARGRAGKHIPISVALRRDGRPER